MLLLFAVHQFQQMDILNHLLLKVFHQFYLNSKQNLHLLSFFHVFHQEKSKYLKLCLYPLYERSFYKESLQEILG